MLKMSTQKKVDGKVEEFIKVLLKCDKSKKRNMHTIYTQRNRITYIINKIINKNKLTEDFQACPARRRPWSRTGKHYN